MAANFRVTAVQDIALPRPYGAMAPFKPSEPGSTMRHTVKPQPREIEI